MLKNYDHDRQWFNTLIPPSHETAAVTVDCISRLSGRVRLILRYTTVDIHCTVRVRRWNKPANVLYAGFKFEAFRFINKRFIEYTKTAMGKISLKCWIPSD